MQIIGQNPNIDKRVIQLLKELAKKSDSSLIPSLDSRSHWGFSYPEVSEFLRVEKGRELPYLEELASLGYLEKEFFDKVCLCPYCHSAQLNLKLSCPNCGSSNIVKSATIHHFRCAYVGPEENFLKGNEYVCPKCGKVLQHIGIDYEKPGIAYICQDCQSISPFPKEKHLCLNCGRSFDLEDVESKNIYTYKINPEAVPVIESEQLYDYRYYQAISDGFPGLHNFSFFKDNLSRELKRASVYSEPFSILLVRFFPEEVGEKLKREALESCLSGIQKVLQPFDIIARYGEDMVICLLPKRTKETAKATRDKMERTLKGVYPQRARFKASIALATYPVDGKDEDGLLNKLSQKISR